MCRLLFGLLLLLFSVGGLAQSARSASAPNLAGKVELVEGEVTVYDATKKPRRVAVGDALFEGEGIVTGPDGELHLEMEDGGFIAVRPNTKMSIAAYRAEGDERDKSVFSLLAGTFRSVTGWIGKYNPRSYQVRTPTATIGVRGTDHEPLVIPQGATEGEPGSYDKVNAGSSYIRTQHGSIEVKPNQAGFAPWKGRPVPRLLPQVPRFFKATRHETAIAARHEAVRRIIDQRREARRQLLLERKTQIERQKAERRKALQERRQAWQTQRRQQEERRKEWQENHRQGLQEGDRQGGAKQRRQRLEEWREERLKERERPQRHGGREHAPRGGGRGRD